MNTDDDFSYRDFVKHEPSDEALHAIPSAGVPVAVSPVYGVALPDFPPCPFCGTANMEARYDSAGTELYCAEGCHGSFTFPAYPEEVEKLWRKQTVAQPLPAESVSEEHDATIHFADTDVQATVVRAEDARRLKAELAKACAELEASRAESKKAREELAAAQHELQGANGKLVAMGKLCESMENTVTECAQRGEEVIAERDAARASVAELKQRVAELEADRARLAKELLSTGDAQDRARLDWLEQNKERIFCFGWNDKDKWVCSGNATDKYSGCPILGEAEDLRSAIDAAKQD